MFYFLGRSLGGQLHRMKMITITDFFFGELKQKRVSEPGPEKEEALLADREAGGQHRGSGAVEVEASDASHAVDLSGGEQWV